MFNAKLVGPNSLLAKLEFICVLFGHGSKQNCLISLFVMLLIKHLCVKLDLNSETRIRKSV